MGLAEAFENLILLIGCFPLELIGWLPAGWWGVRDGLPFWQRSRTMQLMDSILHNVLYLNAIEHKIFGYFSFLTVYAVYQYTGT